MLACAGLQRLGLDARIRSRLDAPQWLPAPAQGAIAIECRDDDDATRALCAVLDDPSTRTCVEAERAKKRALHGSCHVPVAAFAQLQGDHLALSGLVGSVRDGRLLRAQSTAQARMTEALGVDVANALLAQGAGALIAASGEPDSGAYVS